MKFESLYNAKAHSVVWLGFGVKHLLGGEARGGRSARVSYRLRGGGARECCVAGHPPPQYTPNKQHTTHTPTHTHATSRCNAYATPTCIGCPATFFDKTSPSPHPTCPRARPPSWWTVGALNQDRCSGGRGREELCTWWFHFTGCSGGSNVGNELSVFYFTS